MRWLVDSWDHRDPQDDLHDIDCGRYLQALHTLPQSLRQLLEDNSLYIELQEIDNKYQVTKITKKRESEFLQGTEKYFVYDDEGNRIPLSENEFDKLLNLEHDSEDLFETNEIQLETLDSEHTAPMDVWDIVFDASEYIKEAEVFVNAWNEGRINPQLITNNDPEEHLQAMQDTSIYSADWFPYAADKRIHSNRAKEIAEAIVKRDLTKAQLGAMIGPREPDCRVRAAQAMKIKAKKLKPGKEKADLLIKAQKLLLQTAKDFRKKQLPCYPTISNSDKNKLWTLWKEKEILLHKETKLISWQFERWYKQKLQLELQSQVEEIQQCLKVGSLGNIEAKAKIKSLQEEASKKLSNRMNELYGQKPVSNSIGNNIPTKTPVEQLEISWLKNTRETFAEEKDLYAPSPEKEEVEVFADWLPSASLLEYPEITDEEWNTVVLMDE